MSRSSRNSIAQDEVMAIGRIVRILQGLDYNARYRVIRYIANKDADERRERQAAEDALDAGADMEYRA